MRFLERHYHSDSSIPLLSPPRYMAWQQTMMRWLIISGSASVFAVMFPDTYEYICTDIVGCRYRQDSPPAARSPHASKYLQVYDISLPPLPQLHVGATVLRRHCINSDGCMLILASASLMFSALEPVYPVYF